MKLNWIEGLWRFSFQAVFIDDHLDEFHRRALMSCPVDVLICRTDERQAG
ncbi:MAG: hypothetical protein J7D60_08165 [Prosthecochloris sp.]|nr:hypothetical protein [Prosthecochloris sp.]